MPRISGARIREARHAAGLTQAALATAAGTRERNIIRWENNQHAPRLEHVAAIAHATGKTVDFFLNGDGDKPAAEEDDEESEIVAALTIALRALVRAELRGGAA